MLNWLYMSLTLVTVGLAAGSFGIFGGAPSILMIVLSIVLFVLLLSMRHRSLSAK